MSNVKVGLFLLIVIPFTFTGGVMVGDWYNSDKMDLKTVEEICQHVYKMGQQEGWNACVTKVRELEAERQKKENSAVPQRHDLEKQFNTSAVESRIVLCRE